MHKTLKQATLFFAMGICFFVCSDPAFAGGLLQERIKQKINASTNVNAAPQQYEQYEPYYLEKESAPAGNLVIKDELGGGFEESNVPSRPAEARRIQSSLQTTPVLSPYAIYRTDYKAEIEDGVVTVRGNVLFEVFRKGWTQIPLIRTNVGLIDAVINRGASFVTTQGGKYFLMIDKPGRYNLDIEFLIKAARERENGPGNFSFEVIPAPISQFEFTMPEEDVDIFVDPSIRTELKKEGKKTVAWAVMPNTNAITVRWTKALPKETITPVKLEPKVYVDTTTYAAIGEGIIRCSTNLNYSILQSEVPNFRIALPEDVSVLEVRGNDLRDWKVSQDKGVQYLDVYLNFGVKGNYILNLNYERKIGEGSAVAAIPSVEAVGVEREKGYFGIAAATNVELAVNKLEHATLIDVKELPSAIWSSTTSPILLAFKYLNHPFNIEIDVTRHEELPVLVAAIDAADYVTLQTDEGKNLTKAIYQIRNNVKQFIRIVLPKNATLWSVFVAGKPVKPAKDKNGSIMIPLEKSQLSGQDLARFPVEIVYLDKSSKMFFAGNLNLSLPQLDIPVSVVNWSLYLPLDYAYVRFSGDMKLSKRRGHGLYHGVVSMKKAALDAVGERRLSSQYAQQAQTLYEEVQTAQVKGVLPIKIDIPEEGRLFNLTKLLVTEKENPRVSVLFVYAFRQLYGWFWLLVFLAAAVFLFKLIRKDLKGRIKPQKE